MTQNIKETNVKLMKLKECKMWTKIKKFEKTTNKTYCDFNKYDEFVSTSRCYALDNNSKLKHLQLLVLHYISLVISCLKW